MAKAEAGRTDNAGRCKQDILNAETATAETGVKHFGFIAVDKVSIITVDNRQSVGIITVDNSFRLKSVNRYYNRR